MSRRCAPGGTAAGRSAGSQRHAGRRRCGAGAAGGQDAPGPIRILSRPLRTIEEKTVSTSSYALRRHENPGRISTRSPPRCPCRRRGRGGFPDVRARRGPPRPGRSMDSRSAPPPPARLRTSWAPPCSRSSRGSTRRAGSRSRSPAEASRTPALLRSGETNLGIVSITGAAMRNAWHGKNLEPGEKPYREIRTLMGFVHIIGHLIARKESGIATFADIKGKRVGLGSSLRTSALHEPFWRSQGVAWIDDVEEVPLSSGDRYRFLAEGRIDAALALDGGDEARRHHRGVHERQRGGVGAHRQGRARRRPGSRPSRSSRARCPTWISATTVRASPCRRSPHEMTCRTKRPTPS